MMAVLMSRSRSHLILPVVVVGCVVGAEVDSSTILQSRSPWQISWASHWHTSRQPLRLPSCCMRCGRARRCVSYWSPYSWAVWFGVGRTWYVHWLGRWLCLLEPFPMYMSPSWMPSVSLMLALVVRRCAWSMRGGEISYILIPREVPMLIRQATGGDFL